MKRRKKAQGYGLGWSSQTTKSIKLNKSLESVKSAPKSITSYIKAYPATNLPVSLTSFIGRQSEIEAICQLITNPEIRLVTLVGTAGIGKTRLSLAVGEQLKNQFADGSFFVNLAAIAKPEEGLVAIAQSLGIRTQAHLPLLEIVKTWLQKRALLLVLDNFEQIMDLAPAISELLLAAPRLKIIVTSRVVLHLYGEHVYSVPTLELIEPDENTSFETLCQNEAIKLFSQRAVMVNPRFNLTTENAQIIANLCIHLEGLPLAIELAAARCDVFSPLMLVEQLSAGKRFELLVGKFSNLPPRQQTLVNALEWSYLLLSEPEQQLFRSLGIFVGSFSLEAIIAVCKNYPNDTDNNQSTLEAVTSFLNKSLLKQVEALPGELLRFSMLETLREYAYRKLVETGELEKTRAAYISYFTQLVETGVENLKKPDQFNWLKRLEADHLNILNILDYVIEQQEVEAAYRLGGSIWAAWWRWGYLSQGRQWLEKTLELAKPDLDLVLQGKVSDGMAYLAMYQSDYQTAEIYYKQSIQIWRTIGASNYLGRAISGLAGAYRTLGDYTQALQLNYEALELFRLSGDKVSEADSLSNIAWQLLGRGNHDSVAAMLDEALAIHTQANYIPGIARTKIYLGDFLWQKGEQAASIEQLEEAISLLRQVNHRIQLPAGLYRLGLVYLCQGRLDLAEKALEENLEISQQMDKLLDLNYAYSCLGFLRLAQDRLVEAETLFKQALDLRSKIGQLEAVLWAIEGLAAVNFRQARYSEAEQMIQEAQQLRKEIFAPVLEHSFNFILPIFPNYAKMDSKALSPSSKDFKTEPDNASNKREFAAPSSNTLNEASNKQVSGKAVLTERESEVLKLVAEGLSNNQIANLLVISPGTVNNHLSSIYSKLGVNSRTAAIRHALDHNLL